MRLEPLDERDRLAPVRRLTDDLDVLRRAEQRLQPGAHDEVVVGEDDTDGDVRVIVSS